MGTQYRIDPEDLAKIWPHYKRWEDEGRPHYSSQFNPNPKAKPQFYYDSYHDSIRPIKDQEGFYEFDIQTDNSPDGNDTWIEGKFTWENNQIKIIEQKCYTR